MGKGHKRKRCFFGVDKRSVVIAGALIMWFSCVALLPLQALAAATNEITVSAAASLKNSFEEIGKAFEMKEKGAKVYFNFASSGDLMRQIEGGAPVDVFASAATREMDALEGKKLLLPGTRYDFAGNSVVLVRPASGKVGLKSFADLKGKDIKKIAIGNPATVPAGMYAEQALKYFKVWDDIRNKLIFGENVRQVLDYVARGEVDAGIVFSTDAGVRANEVAVAALSPEESHGKVVYPIAVIKKTKNENLARAFVHFVRSPEGRKILEKYGFKAVR